MDLLKWGLAFNRSCNRAHVKRSIPVIRDISVLSQELFDDLKHDEGFTFHYEKNGLMMLCKTQKGMEEEIKVANLAKESNLEVSVLTSAEIKEIEPKANIDSLGAVLYKCDYHTTPHEFMNDMKSYLLRSGIKIHANEEVKNFQLVDNEVKSVITDKSSYESDEVVLASGSWSGLLAKKLGLRLLMQAGKGYRINTKTDYGISIPAILSEKKIAITPMNGFTRVAGTMEIAGINTDINKVRVEAIANGARLYYPDLNLTAEEKGNAACGLRPVTPDGLPYIGKSKACKNLTLAAGHAMMGWSMATATGKLVQEVIDDKKPSVKMELFNPDRRF